jgi:hypothetical protein
LNKVPHLVQLHDADGLNLTCFGTKPLNILAKLMNPSHHGCMRNACESRYTAKPNAL